MKIQRFITVIHRFTCTGCGHSFRRPALFPERRSPRCPACGAPSRHSPLGDLTDELNSRIGI